MTWIVLKALLNSKQPFCALINYIYLLIYYLLSLCVTMSLRHTALLYSICFLSVISSVLSLLVFDVVLCFSWWTVCRQCIKFCIFAFNLIKCLSILQWKLMYSKQHFNFNSSCQVLSGSKRISQPNAVRNMAELGDDSRDFYSLIFRDTSHNRTLRDCGLATRSSRCAPVRRKTRPWPNKFTSDGLLDSVKTQ